LQHLQYLDLLLQHLHETTETYTRNKLKHLKYGLAIYKKKSPKTLETHQHHAAMTYLVEPTVAQARWMVRPHALACSPLAKEEKTLPDLGRTPPTTIGEGQLLA
jgi:hypothetical protein